MKKQIVLVMLVAIAVTGCGAPKETTVEKTTSANPMVGSSDEGDYIYGGDPSVLVDGDTVYLYTGHDASTDKEVASSIYNIPEYLCYSSTDMVNWTAEGTVMTMDTVDWTSDDVSAWASQVTKYNDKYYLYYCSWDKTGKQSIGVAVSDSATGPFEDIGEPLVRSSVTKPNTSTYNDIDPTVWIETGDDGVEHRYLAWGNGQFYICELNEDMTSVKDQNGDGEITSGKNFGEADIANQTSGLENYTEAPWLYRRSDENGNYYGDYYLFYAYSWRECMAYATTSDLSSGDWSFGNMIMTPNATSNTNHMAVFDFKGKTYFVYHNGSLPGGNGYRRSACVTELTFNDDGSIDLFSETASGVGGQTVTMSLESGEKLSHEGVLNSSADADYPYKNIALGADIGDSDADSEWVLKAGKADTSVDSYVSIESENKAGLYITANKDGSVTLAQDTDASDGMAKKQTFKTLSGDGDGIIFESVSQEGKYLAIEDGTLTLSDKGTTFYIE